MAKGIKNLWKKGNRFYYRKYKNGKMFYRMLEARTESAAIVEIHQMQCDPANVDQFEWASEVDIYIRKNLESGHLSKTFANGRKYVLMRFAADMGVKTVDQVTGGMVERWYRQIQEEIKEGTAQGYIFGLRAFYRWLVSKGRAVSNPATGIKLDRLTMRPRRNFVPKGVVRRLIKEAPTDDLRYVLFCGFHAGMRKLEIIESVPAWFDLGRGCVTVEETPDFKVKDDDRRTIPLSSEFKKFLKRYKLRKPFMLQPEIPRGAARYRWDFRRPFEEFMEEQGVECTAHDMRRSFASNLVSSGVDVFRVAKWLGDGVQVVQRHYAHLLPQDDAIEKIA